MISIQLRESVWVVYQFEVWSWWDKLSKKIRMQLFDSLFFISLLSLQARARSVSEYMEHRNRILELEDASYLGSDLTLTPEEIFANNFLMTYKVKHKNITLKKIAVPQTLK